MKSISYLYSLTVLLIHFFLVNSSIAAEGFLGDQNLEIKGDYWEFQNLEDKILINGKVMVKSPDFLLYCDRLVIHHENNLSDQQDNTNTAQKIKEIYAYDNVIIELNNGVTAFSDKAEYHKHLQKIILKENARIHQGKNQVQGCIITYHLALKSYTIESCSDEQAGGRMIQE